MNSLPYDFWYTVLCDPRFFEEWDVEETDKLVKAFERRREEIAEQAQEEHKR